MTHQIMIHSQKSDFEIVYSESWMIGADQITLPVRFGTLVRDFGPIFIWSGPWSELNWSKHTSSGPRATDLVRIFLTSPSWSGPYFIRILYFLCQNHGYPDRPR